MPLKQIEFKKEKTSLSRKHQQNSLELIIISISCILLVVGVIVTLYFYKDNPDVPTEAGIISAIVIGVPSILFGYLQWRHPIAPKELLGLVSQARSPLADTSAEPSPITGTQPIAAHYPTTAEARTASNKSSEGTAVRANAIFLFNERLPRADEFYGRIGERQTLLDRTYRQASTSIVGERRMGKTWLLQYLSYVAERELGSRFRVVYLSATSPACDTVRGFTYQVLQALEYPEPITESNADLALLQKYVLDLKRKTQPVVLCIDEFEGFDRREEFDLKFFVHLRAIAEVGLSLVVVSKVPLIQIVGEPGKTSGFFNIFEQLSLGPFTRKEAELFVHEKSVQTEFTEREQDTLLHYGQIAGKGWPPLRLQLAGKMLLDDKTLADKNDPSYYRPDDMGYWRHFEKRLEEKYAGAVKS